METSDSKEKDLKDEMYDDPNFCDEEGEWYLEWSHILSTNTKADKQHANMYVNKQSVIHSTAIYDSVYQKLRYHAPISTKSCTLNYESVYQHLRNHLP